MAKMRYGEHPREYLFQMKPTENKTVKGVLVYLHGGGFIAGNAGVLMPNLTPFCRLGFYLYALNYSEDPFPAGIISTLKALNFLQTNLGIFELGIFGDSAGGNLAIQVAACVTNPPVMRQLFEISNCAAIKKLHFPEIKVCASICGLLDRTAIMEKRLTSIMYIENLFMILMTTFCVWMYESQGYVESHEN